MKSNTWDSLWGHIEDLRIALIRVAGIVGVGFLLVFAFHQPLIRFLTQNAHVIADSPLTVNKSERRVVTNHTAYDQVFTLPVGAVVSDSNQIKEYIIAPGGTLAYDQPITSSLLIMGPVQGIILVFKICFWLGIALTAPFWGWALMQFIIPGLHPGERVLLFPFLFLSFLFAFFGVITAYKVSLPIATAYLTAFNEGIGQNAWVLAEYIDYVLVFCMGHVIAAELSLLLLLLVHFRIISAEALIEKRSYMIVGALIVGALLTPPDILTQLLLAVPLILIYEVAIYYAKWRTLRSPLNKEGSVISSS